MVTCRMDTDPLTRHPGGAGTHRPASTDHIEFFFDPLCPWAWITSRFMVEVARHRPLRITWRLISLAVLSTRDPANPARPPHDRVIAVGTQNMRVLAAVSQHHTNADLGALYTAIGRRLHPGGRSSELFGNQPVEGAHLDVLVEALAEVGLPHHHIDAADDVSLDRLVRCETDEALRRTGPDVGTPIVTFDPDDPTGSSYFGPVLERIPRGAEAVALFETASAIALTDGLIELKRSNRREPDFG